MPPAAAVSRHQTKLPPLHDPADRTPHLIRRQGQRPVPLLTVGIPLVAARLPLVVQCNELLRPAEELRLFRRRVLVLAPSFRMEQT